MSYFKKFNYQEEFNYWFDRVEEHGSDVYSYGKGYYVAEILKKIMPLLKIPSEGKICILGTHNCYSFAKLEKFYGKERCVGYDLKNVTNRKNITEGSIVNLNKNLIPRFSFCWNDLGNYSRNPFEKMFGQIVFSNRVISGGVFIGRDSSNRARFPVETLMEEFKFRNQTLLQFFDLNSIDRGQIDKSTLDSHIISFRE